MIDRLFRRGRGGFQSLLTDAASGRLDDDGLRRLETRAVAHPALRAQRDETLALTALLRSQPMTPAPRSFALTRAEATTARRPQPIAWLRSLQAATATAALVLVALIAIDLVIVDPASNATVSDTAATTLQALAAEPKAAAAGRATDTESMQADGGLENTAAPRDGSAVSSPALAPQESPETDAPLLPTPEAAETAPEPTAEVTNAASPPGRSALGWATAIVGLLTAALALAATAASWRRRRSA